MLLSSKMTAPAAIGRRFFRPGKGLRYQPIKRLSESRPLWSLLYDHASVVPVRQVEFLNFVTHGTVEEFHWLVNRILFDLWK